MLSTCLASLRTGSILTCWRHHWTGIQSCCPTLPHPAPPLPHCSVILLLAGLLAQLYFGGSLPVSPWRRRTQQGGRLGSAPRRGQHSGRVAPEDGPQQQLAGQQQAGQQYPGAQHFPPPVQPQPRFQQQRYPAMQPPPTGYATQ